MKIRALTLTLALSACMSSGVKIDQSRLAGYQKGKTTYDQAVADLGQPTQSYIDDSGMHVISYHYVSVQARPESFIPIAGAFIGGADSENSEVSLIFDRNGILQSYNASQGGTGVGKGFSGVSMPRNENQPRKE